MNQDKPWQVAIFIAGSGFLLAAYITIGFWLAKYAVNTFSAERYWLAVGCVAGLVFGIVNIVLLIIRMYRRK